MHQLGKFETRFACADHNELTFSSNRQAIVEIHLKLAVYEVYDVQHSKYTLLNV